MVEEDTALVRTSDGDEEEMEPSINIGVQSVRTDLKQSVCSRLSWASDPSVGPPEMIHSWPEEISAHPQLKSIARWAVFCESISEGEICQNFEKKKKEKESQIKTVSLHFLQNSVTRWKN